MSTFLFHSLISEGTGKVVKIGCYKGEFKQPTNTQAHQKG